MQLGLISPASQAALLLCLCLPFLAPASPEKGGFLACVPDWCLLSSLPEPRPSHSHWQWGGEPGRGRKWRWEEKKEKPTKTWWKREGGWENMMKNGEGFSCLPRESCCWQNRSEGILSMLPTRQMGHSHVFVLIKRRLYISHTYIVAMAKAVPRVL